MKFYDFSPAPNPKRVRMFMAEKGIEVPSVQVNTREQEQFSDDYKAVNPHGVVPTLELDDGTCIGESVAICRYFEETHPEPPLMGRDAKDKAVVEMWNRRSEIEGFLSAAEAFRNAMPVFADRALPGVTGDVPQIPALVERGKKSMDRFFRKLDAQLADNQFVAGDAFSIADITAYVAIDFGGRVDIAIPEDCKNVARWFAQISERPSASA